MSNEVDDLFDVFEETETSTTDNSSSKSKSQNKKRKSLEQNEEGTGRKRKGLNPESLDSSARARQQDADVIIQEIFAKPSSSTSRKVKEDTSEEADGVQVYDVDDDDDLYGDSGAGNKEKLLPKISERNLTSAETEDLPRIQVHTVQSIEACIHEVAVPPDQTYEPIKIPDVKPARDYEFILDPFQKEAILVLENKQSVLVSAHTSAGKTVVAEYAIGMSLRDKQRVIYTTPIKALSNQKYREMYEKFQDVGLMTGDVTINPSSSCLIMTTEILRSMLYRGSEIMREVGWVIFDEIHYMRDKERGVVWEETIILLPDNVHYVFLSATIPNATQFAEWICYLHKQPCHVVYTDNRPVPLQHYIYPAGGEGIYLVVNETGNFNDQNFQSAMSTMVDVGDVGKKGGEMKKRPGASGRGQDASQVYKLVKLIMEQSFQPVIAFAFSKKETEAFAIQTAKLDFNSEQEKKLVDEVFQNAMECLSEQDRKLPQVEHVLPLLKRGIGIHHSGLLPILKETIEILFGEGLIKALFATETFAMGLNMPARTVLFTSCKKFDGTAHRWLSSGEYIQMSGRAGRRGIDERGVVMTMVDEKMPAAVARSLLKGEADPLNSAFRLQYNMILNLLRVEEINPEFMLQRSFRQFQSYAALPSKIEKVKTLEGQVREMVVDGESDVETYSTLRLQLERLGDEMRTWITKPEYIAKFLQPGRMCKVKHDTDEYGWGMVLNFYKKKIKASGGSHDITHVVDMLLCCSSDSVSGAKIEKVRPPTGDDKGEMMVIPILLPTIYEISSVRLHFPSDLRSKDNKELVRRQIKEVVRRFPDGVPLLNPIKDMGVKDDKFKSLVRMIEEREKRLYKHTLYTDERKDDMYNEYKKKLAVMDELKVARADLKQAMALIHMDELKHRKRVLRRLGFCTQSDVIELKGRVGCELSTADELLITEMLFEGVFNPLMPEQICALLSCFVFQEKSQEFPTLDEDLSKPLKQMQNIARKIADISKECKLEIDPDLYVDSFKPHLMGVLYSWSKGAPFSQIAQQTDVFEGSIIRCIRRLEELLREMVCASKTMGNSDLETKFNECIRLIKRDIVFAASLYL